MEWSKIKTIILLMLAGVNIFLLLLVGFREGQGARYEDETRQAVIQVLDRSGISFSLEQLPKDIDLPVLTVVRDRNGEAEISQALLGEADRTGESEVRPFYTGDAGTAEFSMNGSFLVKFLTDRWSCPVGQSLNEASLNCLEEIGFQGTPEEAVTRGSTTELTFCQLWEGSPLFSCAVTLTWQEQTLVQIAGSRLSGEVTGSETRTLLSTPTILMRFLASVSEEGYVCSQIGGMTPGYLSSGSTRPVQLTPVWRITTDTGAYYVDAITGTVTPET